MSMPAAPNPISAADFLAWEAGQPEKWEFVAGRPVRRAARMMAGGTVRHARIAANIVRALGNRLSGGRCAPFGSDLKVQCGTGALRYPDVTVDCGDPRDDRGLLATDPRVLIEVLSPNFKPLMQTHLLHDYQSIESVEQIVLVSQDQAFAQMFTRAPGGWVLAEAEGMEAALALGSVGLELPLAEVYEGVTFGEA